MILATGMAFQNETCLSGVLAPKTKSKSGLSRLNRFIKLRFSLIPVDKVEPQPELECHHPPLALLAAGACQLSVNENQLIYQQVSSWLSDRCLIKETKVNFSSFK